jgi:hypothetical protein
MPYLLDTNIFIQAKNLYYSFEVCPAFWEWLEAENAAGNVFSIQKVGTELQAGADELADWAQKMGAAFFLPPDTPVLNSLTAVSQWVSNQNYDPAATSTFYQVADYYLVAHANAHGFTVVTHEKPADSIRKVKIPNVCIGIGIPTMTPYEMLRVERAQFVLGPKR